MNCITFAAMKITKKRFLLGFIAVSVTLALVRCVFSDIVTYNMGSFAHDSSDKAVMKKDIREGESLTSYVGKEIEGDMRRIASQDDYKESFPDSNAVQLEAANALGVSPVENRDDAEKRKSDLVYVGSNPYFHVAELTRSIPYLVPKASVLIQDIGRNFMDSLYAKRITPHKIIVTSVLRSKEDVQKLRKHNRNATENSCHLYGTTFDISYNHFIPVSETATADSEQEVPTETLKNVLGRVLRGLRLENRCYVKYEVRQACFHITVR